MARKPKLIIEGYEKTVRKLQRLGDRRKLKRVLRKATAASSQVIVRGVRKMWPTDTGLSRRSVTKKILSGKGGYTAIIGVDRAAMGVSHGRTHIPSNIDHLIELGWQTPDGRTVPAIAPLRRGYAASKAEAERVFEQKATAEIEREATRR